jgi:DNA-binding transcriptional LysR family regulator
VPTGHHLPIDVRLLEPFVVMAEELHFTRAAERLHIAQPALSQQIARLERQVGSRLFTRPPVAIALTPAGEALLRRARPALTDLHGAVDEARDIAAGRAGTLTIGHTSGLSWRVVPALTAAFRSAQPRITLRMRHAQVEDQLPELRARTLDLGLFNVSPRLKVDVDVDLDILVAAPRYIAKPPGHARAAQASVTMEELAEEPWIAPPGYYGDAFRAICAHHGFTPRIVESSDSVETIHGMVAAGFGINPGSWLYALRPSDDMTIRPVVDEQLDLVAAYVPPRTAAAAAFVAIARDVLGGFWRQVQAQRLV